MSYNIEESGIYQAAIRFRQLTLKAAKALSSGDIVNGCSLPSNCEPNEADKIKQSLQPIVKRGRPRKIQGNFLLYFLGIFLFFFMKTLAK